MSDAAPTPEERLPLLRKRLAGFVEGTCCEYARQGIGPNAGFHGERCAQNFMPEIEREIRAAVEAERERMLEVCDQILSKDLRVPLSVAKDIFEEIRARGRGKEAP